MTISSSTARNDYVGNGATDVYDYGFRIFNETDLLVTQATDLGVETVLVLNTDYTVTGVGDATGGSITLLDGDLPDDYLLTIRRVVDLVQETDIRNQGEFYANIHEDTFDYLTMIDIQQQDEIDRSFKLVETSTSSPPIVDAIVPDSVLVSNSDGTQLSWTQLSDFVTGMVTDAVVSPTADIALTKLANQTPLRAVEFDASGFMVPSLVTATELGYLTGVSAPIQTQLTGKQTTTLTSGNILVGNGSNVAASVVMSGDAVIGNTGVLAINPNAVSNAKLAQVPTATFKGRLTAGTGDVETLTAAEATSLLDVVVGDSGAGGTKGLVPAPAAGDAAASKFLKADGTWTAPTGSGDVSGPGSATDNALARFDSTTGKVIQDSAATLSDAGVISTAGALLTGLTASRALVTDASKNVSSSAVTDTELGYVSGVTSAIQTQIDSKQATGNYIAALTGEVTASGPGSVAATIAAGAVTNVKVGTGIDAVKLADGSVANAAFQQVAGLTSPAVGTTQTQTLTGKTIDGDDNTVQDLPITALKTNLTDASKFMVRDASGVPTSATKAVPAGVVVGTTDAQVLTLKDIDGGTATNTSRITVPKAAKSTLDGLTRKEATIVYGSDTKKLYADDGTTLQVIGTGSSSGINYITNYDFEVNATSWNMYADAAGVAPVDGTGGAPSSTFARNTTAPLVGTADGVLTKSAANRQGEGVSYDFTVDSAYKYSALTIAFPYATSANYVDGDVRAYLYDVTNGVVIEPSVRDLAASSPGIYVSTFQATGSTSYRLILHISSTSALAYTVNVDNVTVGPSVVPATTPAVQCLLALTSNQSITTSTVTDVTNFNTVVYDNTGSWSTTNDEFTVPVSGIYDIGFQGAWGSSATGNRYIYYRVNGGTVVNMNAAIGTASNATILNARALAQLVKGDKVKFAVWQSSGGNLNLDTSGETKASITLVKAEAEPLYANREISFDVNKGGTNQTGINPNGGSYVKITWPTKVYDTTGSFDTTNSRFVAPSSGRYHFDTNVYLLNTNILGDIYGLVFFKNGSLIKFGPLYTTSATSFTGRSASCDLDLVKGDYIEVHLYGNGNNSASTLTANGTATFTHFSGHKVNTVVANGASEKVVATYTHTVAESVANTGAGLSPVNFGTKLIDTHNAVITGAGVWKFTAPMGGTYRVSSSMWLASALYAVGNATQLQLFKNGGRVFYLHNQAAEAAVTQNKSMNGMAYVELLKGDYIHIAIENTRSAGATNTVGSGEAGYVTIEKV